MLKKHFLTAYRNLTRNLGFSLINISGLAIGLTACIFISLWVVDELSYDRHFTGPENLYRITFTESGWSQPRTPHPMALAMVSDFPEVIAGTSLSPLWGPGLTRRQFMVEYRDKRFHEKEILSADSTFTRVFDLHFIEGEPEMALKTPLGVVITESTARKYFGDTDALGEQLRFEDEVDLFVTGVVKDLPPNTHFGFDFLISYVTLKQRSRETNQGRVSDYYTWKDFGHYNYIRLAPETNPEEVESKIMKWLEGYLHFTPDDWERIEENRISIDLQPVKRIHLHSDMVWELSENGDIGYVYAFSATALLILVIAIFNYMNLSTARSEKRAREVGVKKTIGANKFQLVTQFFIESILMSFLAVLLAAVLVELLMPFFSGLTGKDLGNLISENPGYFLSLLFIALTVGSLSGIYPSFFLSSFRPVKVLKGRITETGKTIKLRKFLVTFQFAISVFLIICTLVIYAQLKYLQGRYPGFNSRDVLVIPVASERIRDHVETLREQVLSHPGITGFSAVSNIPGGTFNNNSITLREGEEEINTAEWWVDEDFLDLMEIRLAEGRGFEREFTSDSLQSFLLNETACRALGLTPGNAIGEVVTWYGDNPGTQQGRVIGVVKDFNFKSLHENIGPLIIQRTRDAGMIGYVLIKTDGKSFVEVSRILEKTWKEFDPKSDFSVSMLEKDFQNQYGAENQLGLLFWIFSALAFLVAGLGLLGLAAYTVEQKTKEIGIRKVMGASQGKVFLEVTKGFLLLILLSNLVAWPAAFLLVRSWLNNYPYKTGVDISAFLLGTVLALVIALAATAYQSIRASRQDPVDSLRSE